MVKANPYDIVPVLNPQHPRLGKPLTKRTTKMATRKRKTAKKRSTTVVVRTNPTFGTHRPTLKFGKGGWSAPKTKKALVKSGTRVNPKKRRKSAVRSNPMSLKGLTSSLTNKKMLVNSLMIAGGLVGGIKINAMLDKNAWVSKNIPDKFRGVLVLALGLIGAGMAKKDAIRMACIGLAGSGAYDILSKTLLSKTAAPLAAADVPWGMVYGDDDLTEVSAADVPWNGDDDLDMLGDDDLVDLGDDDDLTEVGDDDGLDLGVDL